MVAPKALKHESSCFPFHFTHWRIRPEAFFLVMSRDDGTSAPRVDNFFGKEDALVFRGLCGKHDNDIFASIEKTAVDLTNHSTILCEETPAFINRKTHPLFPPPPTVVDSSLHRLSRVKSRVSRKTWCRDIIFLDVLPSHYELQSNMN